MQRVRTLYVLFAMICASAAIVYAQAVSATLLGTVTDASGAVVPNAKVTATEVNTSTNRSGPTNESGNYSFSNLPPGRYSVTVEAAGFKKETRTAVDVLVDTTTRVDIQLVPGAITETVEVTGAAPTLQTDRADTSMQIATVQTANLPLGTNRNFQSLLNLVPGTTPASYQHSAFFNASNSLQTEVDGQMRMGNSYQIEGIDDNERTGLLQIYVPPIEAIDTVDVATSNFEAELGRATGANTNVVIKSGTNQLHGAAYEFLRNNDFNARNFFDKSIGHQAYNYIGGNLGGPIKKNKIFIFGDYLKVYDHQADTNTGTIPPAPWRTGDFSAQSNVIYDPATGNPDGTGRQPFPGRIVPANRINPISAKILALVPLPNQQFNNAAPSSNFFALLPKTDDTDSFDVKIDDNISDKGRLSGRFSYARPIITQAPVFGQAGGFAQGAFEGNGIQKTYTTGINYDRIFSPTLIAEFRIGVAHYHNDALPTDYGTAAATQLGIPGANIDQWTSGMPSMNIGGFSSPLVGYSASLPWRRAEVNGDIANTWTKTRGNHTIKFGLDYRRIRDDLLQTQTVNPRGQWNFGANQTSLNPGPGGGAQPKTGPANDLASFLLDVPSFAGRDLAAGYFPALRGNELFLFVQDKWQATQKLTVDLGLRWELYSPFTPHFAGGFSNYNPNDNTLQIAGIGGVPSDLGMQTRYKNFAPRVGLAYRLTDKTVVRAGFGVSYTPFPDNSYAFNYPVKQNKQYNAPNSFAVAVLDNGVSPAVFQSGFPAPVFAAIPSTGIIPNPDPNQADFVVPQNFKNPSVQSWNIAVQRALPGRFTLDVAYVGNHGVDSVVAYNLNLPTTVLGGGNASKPLNQKFGRTADTTVYWDGMSSHYNALQVKLDRRFSNGLAITTAYTWGKGLGYQNGDDGGLWSYYDQQRSYARNNYDRTQTFAQSYVYDLPVGVGKKWLNHGIAARVLGGWQVNGIFMVVTGTPLTFGANGGVLNTPGTPQTADQVGPYQVLGGINVPSQGGSPYFLQSSFVQPGGVRLGTSGRDIVSGPGYYNLDASIFKIVSINEKIKAEIRGESFSVLNNPHFSNPDTGVADQNYGYITGAGGARNLQLGLKVSF